MSLSQQERDQRDVSMFGMSSDALREIAETSIYRSSLDERGGDAMLIMSILSDAQEEMSLGDKEMARKFINRAKYLLSYYYMERE